MVVLMRVVCCTAHIHTHILAHYNSLHLPFCPALYNERQRRSAYTQEREAMEETAKALMDERKGREAIFTSATHMEHVRPMFKTVWASILAAFSIALEDSDDHDVVLLCLEGFRCAIRVACVFGLKVIGRKNRGWWQA